jgi:flagellar hook-length control protein FliK
VVPNVPLGAVAVEIGLRSLAGMNRFEIRLNPEELGRIDVSLDIGEDGAVTARLVVDRVETLALLQRDAKTLERAFEQAGLTPSEGGVGPVAARPPGRRPGPRSGARRRTSGGRTEAPDAPLQPLPVRPAWRAATGLDLRI